ncbi:hypothetical protein GLAREA_12105 [Glarea lozoyensis ATCC 20868]|uniref:Magnesium transport protein CorA, transmembrane region n=1 Tax=Glarea lozoyensis (strain ATCC 20868 / MF5171) TaxID=1116229 RepID=S3E0F4_GLAL2|nr:uncharacterized protein GLAREA_12105 [Glarea lozoyensis ATCC 20868]EPE32023.1 hypothetical protein GLAREA_12105 [Glarea lozoyensis ATCC 20868]
MGLLYTILDPRSDNKRILDTIRDTLKVIAICLRIIWTGSRYVVDLSDECQITQHQALFSRLGFENADGRLSGQEHRGRFPHTLFLQPQATVSEENPNDQKETMLFMPYLHFETNQGRIGLSNALSRMARSLTEKNMGDNPLSLSPQNDAASTVEDFAENDPSDDDSDDDLIKGPTEKKFEQYKEKFKQFRRLIKHYQKTTLDSVSQTSAAEDEKLVQAYLASQNHRLHIRRTLDQFYYLGMEDTEDRDTNQVVQRYALKGLDKIDENQTDLLLQSKLIMVDQLWLWILGKGTVITSFPQGWGQAAGSEDEHVGMLEQIKQYLREPGRDPIRSAEALASVIIKECTQVFGRFQVSEKLQFLDFFDSSISDVADRHSRIFAKLGVGWDDEDDFVETKAISLSNKSKKDKRKEKYKAKKRKMMKKAQLYINEEVELLVEIQDIRDELRIIEMVLEDQYTVLADVENETQQPKSLTHISRAKFPPVDGKPVDSHVKFNRRSIEHMVLGARDVYNAIYHLIDLKQKQANITEARYARREANSAAKEGRTILALTIVNMIFLPLSFMTSFFSLDIVEFPKDPVTQEKDLPLRWVAKYIFGISIAIALPSIALAMAIGPMAGFAKKLGRAVRYWAANILGVIGGLIVLVLLTAIAIALIPVAVGLLSSSSRLFIRSRLFLFLIREASDLEDATRDEGPEIRINDEFGDGINGESENVVNEKAPVVMERSIETQNTHGKVDEIEEVHQWTMP